MATPKFTPLELQIMEAVWQAGQCSVREIQETFPEATSDAPNGSAMRTSLKPLYHGMRRKKVQWTNCCEFSVFECSRSWRTSSNPES
jgi:hypothetical protein